MTAVVQIEQVSRTFGGLGEIVALRDVSLEIEPGQILAIEGPSGSGKSTLLNVLGLLDRPTEGRYWLGGSLTGHLKGRDRSKLRAELLGFVFQGFHLLPNKNVIDNVVMGAAYQGVPYRTRYQLALSALEELGLEHRLTAMPPTLSGGELQRTAIARAVIGEKKVLLCDEPTGNLDRASTELVLSVLRRMAERGIAIAVATHDPMVSIAADTVLLLVDGHTETEGSR